MDLQSKIGIKKKKNRFFETYLSKILKKISEKKWNNIKFKTTIK